MKHDVIWKLETNLDDCSGENLGYVMDLLLERGARDVFYTPIYMKKNRPAVLLSVLCSGELVEEMEELLFENTTTIGIRKQKMERTILERREGFRSLEAGEVRTKIVKLPSGREREYPEYESIHALARESGKSYRELIEDFYRRK